MKWSEEKTAKLRELCFAEISNAEIAKQLGMPVNEIHAKRSQLNITIPKIKAAKGEVAVSPEIEKAVQDMDDRAAFRAKQELIQLLEPAILMADKSVKELKLVNSGKTALIILKNGVGTLVDIDGDSLLAIIADVTRKCLF